MLLPAVLQIADFGMSRVLENNMTHVSTNSHGEQACIWMTPVKAPYTVELVYLLA